ncbi:hypothetical protein FGO68_gene12590 [Halteria grandinella]|uniref:Uncharacterized protein n=1 Tax=Halteria grandinella TaxID=5974 RepID=A0A8J8NN00_HALGN|nr:hypothetical protein FGO68_gene12590 [Halteria grandinella]
MDLKRKKKEENSESGEAVAGGSDEEEEEDEYLFKPNTDKSSKKSKVIDVDFELVQPSEAYYHSVRALLNQYLDGEDNETLDISGLADQVVNTVSIGSVVASALEQDPADMPEYQDLPDDQFDKIALKFNQDRDVYGFMTILSLTKRAKQIRGFQQIIDYVLAKASKHCNEKQKETFTEVLGKQNVGLLLNERLINLPYILVPQLHESLPEDLRFTKRQDDIEDPKEFDYQYLLVISRYSIENARSKRQQAAQATNKRMRLATPSSTEEKLYYKAEDELFLRSAESHFSFKTIFRETMEDGTKKVIVGGGKNAPETQYKLVYLIRYSAYENRIRELNGFLKALQ